MPAKIKWRSIYPLLFVLLFAALATTLMELARWLVVEPATLGASCAANGEPLLCRFRSALVFGFTRDVFGVLSVVAGLFATLIRWRWVAAIAMFAGIAGAVLYRFELSGAGLLLGALVLVRSRAAESTALT